MSDDYSIELLSEDKQGGVMVDSTTSDHTLGEFSMNGMYFKVLSMKLSDEEYKNLRLLLRNFPSVINFVESQKEQARFYFDAIKSLLIYKSIDDIDQEDNFEFFPAVYSARGNLNNVQLTYSFAEVKLILQRLFDLEQKSASGS